MDAAQKMALFGNLALVFTAIAIIGLGLSIFFFFFFDIRSVYALMTGKAKRQTIERMAQNNSRTGRLQPVSGSVRDPSIPVVQNPVMAPTADMRSAPENPAPAPVYAAKAETVGLGATPDTTVLSVTPDTTVLGGSPETMVLNAPAPVAGETMILTEQPAAAPAPAPAQPKIRFDITESTLVIHTNEII